MMNWRRNERICAQYYHRAIFSKFLPATLRYFPILNYGIFLVAVADICVIFLIFYMSKQLYTTPNTGFKMRDFAYY